MISPHTPPGKWIEVDIDAIVDGGRKFPIGEITICSLVPSGFVAVDPGTKTFYCLEILRRLDLPSCITDCLDAKPVDAPEDVEAEA